MYHQHSQYMNCTITQAVTVNLVTSQYLASLLHIPILSLHYITYIFKIHLQFSIDIIFLGFNYIKTVCSDCCLIN